MKPASLLSVTVFVVACHRGGSPSSMRAPAPAPTASTQPGEIQNLDLPMKQVDDLPIANVIDPGATTKQPVREAIAVLTPTSGQTARGVVRFVETAGLGIDVYATIDGLDAKPHAYHVHVYGDCSAPDGTSAGPHFHFHGSSFDKETGMITGNLGELKRQQASDPSSTAHQHIPHASLQGEFSIIGRAVVVHAEGNDPSVTPDGGAGARLACGVIGVGNPGVKRQARR